MTMTKTLMIVAELAVINWGLIVAASLVKAQAWKPAGLMAAMGNRETESTCSPFAARTDRTARNMLENMVVFTALALVASIGGVNDAHVELGARLFFWARLAYIPIYMIGIPVARTGAWAISVVGMGMIFAAIVQAFG
jgi:uncharacterized MAPEG superfamily protein